MLYSNFLTNTELENIEKTSNTFVTWQDGHTTDKRNGYRIVKKTSVLNDFPYLKEKVWNKLAPTSSFDIEGVSQMDMLHYQPGGKYDWHQDVTYGAKKERKYTFIIQLTDSSKYKGGNLEFLSGYDIDTIKSRQQGTLIVFPSYLQHRISPILEGERYSIVGWISGPPWK